MSSSGGSGMWRVSEGVLTTPSLQGGGGALSPGDAGPRRGREPMLMVQGEPK